MMQQENGGGRQPVPAPSDAAAVQAEGRPPFGRAVTDAAPLPADDGELLDADAVGGASDTALDNCCEGSSGQQHAAAAVDYAAAVVDLSASPEARVEQAVPVLGVSLLT